MPGSGKALATSSRSGRPGLALLLGCALFCCRETNPPSEPASNSNANTGSAGRPLSVAILVPGSLSDAGWNYSAKEAADRIAAELEISPKVLDKIGASERKTVLRSLAREGTRLIICHGYEFNSTVRELAPQFPAVQFVVSGYDQPDPHFLSMVFDLSEAAYLCGVIAAVISETGHAGFVSAQQTPPVALCYEGFRKGFLGVRPQGTVRPPVYIEGENPWEDAAAAKIKTQTLLRADQPAPVDVLFQNTDTASSGVFEAVSEASRKVFVFGANRDQNENATTDRVPASAVIRVDRAFLEVVREVRAGQSLSGVRRHNLRTGVVDCVLNRRLDRLVGAETAERVRRAVAEARAKITSGQVSSESG